MPTSEYEFVWACGLFEGEGTCNPRTRTIQLAMTDQEVVERFHRAVGGVGAIYRTHSRTSQMFSWNVCNWHDSSQLAKRMLPHMGARRQVQLQRLLANPPRNEHCHKYGVCNRGHDLAEVGRTKHGACKACIRLRRAARGR